MDSVSLHMRKQTASASKQAASKEEKKKAKKANKQDVQEYLQRKSVPQANDFTQQCLGLEMIGLGPRQAPDGPNPLPRGLDESNK